MSHAEELWTTLRRWFPELPEKSWQKLGMYSNLLCEWNAKINLISRKDTDRFEVKHLAHCLAVTKFLRLMPKARMLDVGTGGGLPGIPLAICYPEAKFTLIDSIAKKASTKRTPTPLAKTMVAKPPRSSRWCARKRRRAGARAAAGQVPRPDGRADALPQARARPHREPRRAPHVRAARPRDVADPALPRRPRLPRARDAAAPLAARRRRGQALRAEARRAGPRPQALRLRPARCVGAEGGPFALPRRPRRGDGLVEACLNVVERRVQGSVSSSRARRDTDMD